MQAMATGEVDFFGELITQRGKASAEGEKVNERRPNFMLAVIKGIERPARNHARGKDGGDSPLSMNFAVRLNNTETLVQQNSAERTLNKLARTFAAQLEALKGYRTGGEQKVTVQHASVSGGGQAIVGNVSHDGDRGDRKRREATP